MGQGTGLDCMKNVYRLTLTICASVLACATGGVSAYAGNIDVAEVDRRAKALMKKRGMVGMAVAVIDDDTARARLESLAPAHALGRIGTVEEIAEACEYLARAEWTTGNVLTVDGGLGLGVTDA